MWGLPFSLPTPLRHSSSEVEVQLREWPSPVPAAPPVEAVKIEEAPPAVPIPRTGETRAPPEHAGPAGGRANGSDTVQSNRVEVQLPERLPTLPTLEAQHDPIRLAEGVRDSLQDERYEPRLADLATLPELPAPARQGAEMRPLPSLPTLAPPTRRESVSTRPATITLPSPQLTALIKGPASERTGDLSATSPQCDRRE